MNFVYLICVLYLFKLINTNVLQGYFASSYTCHNQAIKNTDTVLRIQVKNSKIIHAKWFKCICGRTFLSRDDIKLYSIFRGFFSSGRNEGFFGHFNPSKVNLVLIGFCITKYNDLY